MSRHSYVPWNGHDASKLDGQFKNSFVFCAKLTRSKVFDGDCPSMLRAAKSCHCSKPKHSAERCDRHEGESGLLSASFCRGTSKFNFFVLFLINPWKHRFGLEARTA